MIPIPPNTAADGVDDHTADALRRLMATDPSRMMWQTIDAPAMPLGFLGYGGQSYGAAPVIRTWEVREAAAFAPSIHDPDLEDSRYVWRIAVATDDPATMVATDSRLEIRNRQTGIDTTGWRQYVLRHNLLATWTHGGRDE